MLSYSFVTNILCSPILLIALLQSSSFANVDKTMERAFVTTEITKLKGEWKVKKANWDSDDEKGFESFVVQMAKSGCNTVDNCIKNKKANPFFEDWEKSVYFYADCGRFPYLLRMYYAWKNGLPFSAITKRRGPVDEVNNWVKKQLAAGVKKPNPDRDFPTNASEKGILMVNRHAVPNSSEARYNFFQYAKFIVARVNSSNYRFDVQAKSPESPDFYPVAIQKNSIKPGTILYDAKGHVAVVYEITSSGDIKMLDAHPDNSVTRKTWNRTYKRSRPEHGAGFKNWRPFKLEEAELRQTGLVGGKIKHQGYKSIKDFSQTQFVGTHPDPSGNWKKGKFIFNNHSLDYHEYVKLRLAAAGTKIEPLAAVMDGFLSLCQNFRDRVKDVDAAIAKGLDRAPHPLKMPKNIYNDEGDWENFSTPGRDLRMRQLYFETLKQVKDYSSRLDSKDPTLQSTYSESNGQKIQLTGRDFQKLVYEKVQLLAQSCEIQYVNSAGAKTQVGFFELIKRLSQFSFSPFHCVERRWGAQNNELKSCKEDSSKREWHSALAHYRRIMEPEMSYENDLDLKSQIAENQIRLQKLPALKFDLEEALE